MGTLLNRRRYMGGGSSLPYDAEIEYLESNGTQYIDTGIIADNGVLVEMKAAFVSGNIPIVGVNTNGNIISVAFYTTRYVTTYKGGTQIYNTVNPRYGTFFDLYFDTRGLDYIVKWNESKKYNTQTNFTISSSDSIKLFTIDGINISNSRVKTLRLTDSNNNVVFDAKAVRVGQTGYLYDKVSGKLFGNAGTGDFILGNDK